MWKSGIIFVIETCEYFKTFAQHTKNSRNCVEKSHIIRVYSPCLKWNITRVDLVLKNNFHIFVPEMSPFLHLYVVFDVKPYQMYKEVILDTNCEISYLYTYWVRTVAHLIFLKNMNQCQGRKKNSVIWNQCKSSICF